MLLVKRAIMPLLLIASVASAQQNKGDRLVLVPEKYLSQEALAHEASPQLQEASKWVGFGKEVGQAMNEGLAAVVTQTDRFGATRVGTFVMIMVAWKVIGHELLAAVLGIPMMLAGVCLWIYSMRRFFWGRPVLASTQDKVKQYRTEVYQFKDSESRMACGVFHGILIVVWLMVWITIIF